jgi:hypothetical protein
MQDQIVYANTDHQRAESSSVVKSPDQDHGWRFIGDMDVEYARAVADRAIRSMSQQSVPATPRHFSVWFNYAMGAMVEEIDRRGGLAHRREPDRSE